MFLPFATVLRRTTASLTRRSVWQEALKRLRMNVLGGQNENVTDRYTLGVTLGKGQFGVTKLATEKTTGNKYACKSIAKRKLTCKEDVEDVQREVQIMHHLAGHSNIVEMKDAFEDKTHVHLVLLSFYTKALFEAVSCADHGGVHWRRAL